MSMGNSLIIAGIALVLIGIAYKFGLLNWFGNLPGDIKYEGENTKFYFPVVTMLLISVILSLLFAFFKK
jgi:hypothetical protein